MGEAPLGSDDEIRELSRSLRKLALELVSDRHAAEDLVQNAWLALLQAPGRSVRHLGAWMRAALRHDAESSARRSTLRRDHEVAAARPDVEPLDDVAEWRSTAHMLIDAVAELDDPYRAVLRARYFEERSVDGKRPAGVVGALFAIPGE